MRRRNQKPLSTSVLIVGGGPSGMIAALCLAACGVSSIIVEKRDRPARHPKAHEISARTIEILTSLGVRMQDLVRESSPHEDAARILFCRTLGEELGRIDLAEKDKAAKYAAHTAGERPYLNLSQTELEKILRKKILATKRVRLLNGFEWLALRQNASGVVSQVRPVAGVAVEIHSEYLLCCDGAGGRCRSALGISMDGPEKIQDFVNAYFTDDLRGRLPAAAKLFFIFKPDAAGTLIAHHAGRRWVYHVPVMTPHERVEDYTEAVLRRRIANAIGDPGFAARIESISSWRMTAQVAQSFQSGRAFLVGDAAHRFPPTGGLGLNSGVADAHNIAWKIAAVIRGDANASLPATYEAERKPVVSLNCAESRRNYLKLFDILSVLGVRAAILPGIMAVLARTPFRWFGVRFREAALRVVYATADRLLRRYFSNARLAARTRSAIRDQHGHFDRIGLDLGYIYSTGAVVHAGKSSGFSTVTEYRPQFTPGARLPIFYWRTQRQKRMSHRLLSYGGFALFTSYPASWQKVTTGLGIKPSIVHVAPTIELGGKACEWATVAGGALLVRPDGHVAAQLAESGDRGSALRAVLTRLGYDLKHEAKEERLAS